MDVSLKRLWLFIVVNNNESYVFRLSHDEVTCDVDRDVWTAYCSQTFKMYNDQFKKFSQLIFKVSLKLEQSS